LEALAIIGRLEDAMLIDTEVLPYIADFPPHGAGPLPRGGKSVVLSLLGLAPPEYLTLCARPTDSEFQSVSFTQTDADLQAMVGLGMSGAIAFSAKAESKVYYYLSRLHASAKAMNTDAHSVNRSG
jgi:hypothetical protein